MIKRESLIQPNLVITNFIGNNELYRTMEICSLYSERECTKAITRYQDSEVKFVRYDDRNRYNRV